MPELAAMLLFRKITQGRFSCEAAANVNGSEALYFANDTGNDEQWTEVIEPYGHILDLKLGELWRCRDLIYLFVRRDFVAQYKQTVVGPGILIKEGYL